MIEFDKTERGFAQLKFRDRYGAKCSIQKSSLAAEDAIWFGVDDADPKIMASAAKVINPETNEMTGWVPYGIPKDVLLTTWMHLTREQVAELLPILQWFVETGELPESGTDAAKSLAAKDAEIERLESSLDMAEAAFCELAEIKNRERECPECTGRGPGRCPVCKKDTVSDGKGFREEVRNVASLIAGTSGQTVTDEEKLSAAHSRLLIALKSTPNEDSPALDRSGGSYEQQR